MDSTVDRLLGGVQHECRRHVGRDSVAQGLYGHQLFFLQQHDEQCTPDRSTGIGFLLGGGSTIQGCAAYANSGDGIQVADDSIVLNNECVGNGTGAGAAQRVRACMPHRRRIGSRATT